MYILSMILSNYTDIGKNHTAELLLFSNTKIICTKMFLRKAILARLTYALHALYYNKLKLILKKFFQPLNLR